MTGRPPLVVDVVVEADAWGDALAPLARTAVAAALSGAGVAPAGREVAVLGCDDARIAALNADFRGKARPTNVLSWPSEDRAPSHPGGRPRPLGDGAVELGDIAIAHETCEREAEAQGKRFDAHVTHLLVHATLHLLGFDHETEADAARMERLEAEILSDLGLPDPYLGP